MLLGLLKIKNAVTAKEQVNMVSTGSYTFYTVDIISYDTEIYY